MESMSLQRRREYSTEDCIICGVQAYLGNVYVKVFIWIISTIILLNGQNFQFEGRVASMMSGIKGLLNCSNCLPKVLSDGEIVSWHTLKLVALDTLKVLDLMSLPELWVVVTYYILVDVHFHVEGRWLLRRDDDACPRPKLVVFARLRTR